MKDDGSVHPTTVVDADVQIGAGSQVWHFCHLCPGSVIGRNCVLGQNVYVGPGVRIGNRVKIQNNVSVYAGVELEDDVFCGPSVVFTNVTTPRSFVSRTDNFQATKVRRGASLGANSTILCGVNIGEFAMIGAGAAVTRDVPDYALVVGVPARFVGWVSRSGARLSLPDAGDGVAVCPETGVRYRLSDGSCREEPSDAN